MEEGRQKALVESLLFISGAPLAISELKEITSIAPEDLKDILEELMTEYRERKGGMMIAAVSEGYQMVTSPEFGRYMRKLKTSSSQRLSPASLETLAIVAYKQPITKAEIEALRGVNSDGVVKTLLEKRLVKIMGRKEAPGKPLFYGTTRDFLQYFGLKDLTELPTLKDLEREETL